MNDFSKLMLSYDELQLVTNSNWILTKRKILVKTENLLGLLNEQQQQLIRQEKADLPETVVRSTAKISRGENYLQLPYLILDYPRCFEGEDIFAIRTMFWWGNFFSVTLHLSGKYKSRYQQSIQQQVAAAPGALWVCVHENQWQHHFDAGNYIEAKELSADRLTAELDKKTFVKLAVKFPLESWAEMPALLGNAFLGMVKLLKD